MQIKNYPNYNVTKDGTVINNKKNKELKPSLSSNGYYRVSLCNKNKIKTYKIHRLVAEAFINNSQNKKNVNHINGIKTDNRVENLEWSTSSENNLHAYKIGLKKPSNFGKIILDLKTGVFYENAKDASLILGFKYSTLINYLNGSSPNKTSLIYV
jgi:hypothetical protein